MLRSPNVRSNLWSRFAAMIYYGIERIGHGLCGRNDKWSNFRRMIVHQGISKTRRMVINHLVQFMVRRRLQKCKMQVDRDTAQCILPNE